MQTQRSSQQDLQQQQEQAAAEFSRQEVELAGLRRQQLVSSKEQAALKIILDAKMRPLVAGMVDSLRELAPDKVPAPRSHATMHIHLCSQ